MDSMALPSKNCESVTTIDDCINEIGAKSIGNNWANIVHMATKYWHTRKPEVYFNFQIKKYVSSQPHRIPSTPPSTLSSTLWATDVSATAVG